jgi:hypothetical protein
MYLKSPIMFEITDGHPFKWRTLFSKGYRQESRWLGAHDVNSVSAVSRSLLNMNLTAAPWRSNLFGGGVGGSHLVAFLVAVVVVVV